MASMPTLLSLKGVARNTASGVNTEAIASTSPRSQPRPNASSSARYASLMAPNIPQSGTAGRSVWYTGVRSLFRVFEPGGCDDVEAGARLYGRAGAVRAAPRGAGPRGYRRQRDDDHRPGGRPELLHHERRVRRRPRSEEHTSELQSRLHLVCRLLLEKKK